MVANSLCVPVGLQATRVRLLATVPRLFDFHSTLQQMIGINPQNMQKQKPCACRYQQACKPSRKAFRTTTRYTGLGGRRIRRRGCDVPGFLTNSTGSFLKRLAAGPSTISTSTSDICTRVQGHECSWGYPSSCRAFSCFNTTCAGC
jgi:hypothetical protein